MPESTIWSSQLMAGKNSLQQCKAREKASSDSDQELGKSQTRSKYIFNM
jgi:hypothetical protein